MVEFVLMLSFFTFQGRVFGASYPAPSPDGQYVTFSYYGDIWIGSINGGSARRLTDSEGYESVSLWSPDGKWIAFVSDRYGSDDIFIIPRDGGKPPKRLTYFSSGEYPLFWDENSKYIYFSATRTEYRGAVYRVSITGGTPERVYDFRMLNATLVPDSQILLFERGGTAWWRRKYRGPASRDIWKMDLRIGKLEKITNFEGRDAWPMYSRITGKIYFISNQGNENSGNLWEMDLLGRNRKQITFFREEVFSPKISWSGNVIVFEKLGELFAYDIKQNTVNKLNFNINEDYKTTAEILVKLRRDAREFALSPDEKELAFVVYGDIYVMELDENNPGKIKRITFTPEPEKDIAWNPVTEEIIYTSLEDGDWDLYIIKPKKERKFVDDYIFEKIKVLDTPVTEKKPKFSPDGKKIAFLQNKGTLCVMDKSGKKVKRLTEKNDVLWIDWSPDSRWIAFSRTELGFREDVYVVKADGSTKPFNISNHPNDDYKPMWSSDGRRISFASRNASGDLWIKYVFLRKEDENKDREYWESVKDSLKLEGPVKIDFDGISERIHEVAKFRGEYNYVAQSPDGMIYAIQAENLNSNDIWVVDWFGENIQRLTTSNVEPKMFLVSKDGKRVYYLDKRGVLHVVNIADKKSKALSFNIEVEFQRDKYRNALLREAWWVLNDGFYDPNFHGVDWSKMYDKYLPLALQCRTDQEFRRIVRMMLGELNASHLGIWKSNRDLKHTGCIGAEFIPDKKEGGFKITRVLEESPAMKADIKEGDVILAVNGIKVNPDDNVYTYLEKKAGKKIRLTLKRKNGKVEDIDIKTISPWKQWELVYKEWVKANRELVEKESEGKLGYIHIPAMNLTSLERFKKELYENRRKEGLVLDIRYNGGGNIHDELLNILRRTKYLYSVERGEGEKEYNTLFRWDKPVVLLINQFCYSDAEIFPAGFKQLKLGKVVGVPTYGAVIGTNNLELFDGTTFRQPEEGWYTLDNRPLENNPVEPDIYVENPPVYDNHSGDPQLKKAVEILMQEIE